MIPMFQLKKKKTKGNVYSYMGMKEVKITGLCERCFDFISEEDDEEYDKKYK